MASAALNEAASWQVRQKYLAMRMTQMSARKRVSIEHQQFGHQLFCKAVGRGKETRDRSSRAGIQSWIAAAVSRDILHVSKSQQQRAQCFGDLAGGHRKSSLQPPCAESSAAASQPSKSGPDFQILQFISQQFLPLALVLGMTIGYFFPAGGVRASNLQLQTWTTTGIFIISGLGMRRGEAVEALSSWGSFLFGMLSILVITPLAALIALRLPLHPPELSFGLAVFCCMPTTLSSGVSLTQAIGGNTALALLLTVGSNLLGIFTMPFVLSAVLGSGQGAVHIAPGPLLKSLLKTILAPLLLGIAARAFIPRVAKQVDRKKKDLGRLSAILLAMVPWMQISKAVADNIYVPASSLLAAVFAGLLLHIMFLAFNLSAVNILQLGTSSEDVKGLQRAVVLVASQKTLPIAVAVLSQLSAFVKGPIGVAVIPCVVCHLGQILVDSILVSSWMNEDKQKN